jgi:cytochrome b6-f complex iron-sulfur subunit
MTAMEKKKQGIWSRRDFFSRVGWGGFGAFSFLSYSVGEVSDKFKQVYRVWIVREEEGFYALFAKCTHLGCTPRWLAAEDKFKCPCHGSGYYKSGLNFEGPAPRPLDRFEIAIGQDGQLVVDKSVTYKMQAGVEPDDQYPQSILKA